MNCDFAVFALCGSRPDLTVVGLGALIRAEKAKGTELGQLFEKNTKLRKLQPTPIVLEMLLHQMHQHETTPK